MATKKSDLTSSVARSENFDELTQICVVVKLMTDLPYARESVYDGTQFLCAV